jgi:CheY-like chemotaxis protein
VGRTATETAKALTVLCIEDDSSSLSVIEEAISERPGVELLVATDGAEGTKMARRHRPDLVLADLDLHGMGGEEVLARLRVDPVTRRVPVVMVGADPSASVADRLIARGARTCLAKPLNARALACVLDGGIEWPAGETWQHAA